MRPMLKTQRSGHTRSHFERPSSQFLQTHLSGGHEIPDAPKFFHFGGRAEGHADIGAHGWKKTGDLDVVFLEVFDHFDSGVSGFEHGEIRVRSDALNISGSGLSEEFLP